MKPTVVGIIVLGIVATIYLIFPGILPVLGPKSDDSCGPRPSDAVFLSEQDFELSLGKSIGAFTGRSSPKVLDSFPKEARNAQMAAFMACKAGEQKLITNAAELQSYLETMKSFFETGRFPDRMQHEGALRNLREFVANDPGQSWTLKLSEDVEQIYVPNTTGGSPLELMRKICASIACVSCEGVENIPSDGVVSIRSLDVATFVEKTIDGVAYKECAM